MSRIIKSLDCPDERHADGAIVFREGDPGDGFYIVRSGSIEIYKDHGEPAQLLLATIPAGRVIGEISAIDGGPRTATAVARGETQLVKVSSKTLKWQLVNSPHWFSAIVLDLVERLRATDELLGRIGQKATHHGVTSMKATLEPEGGAKEQ